MRLKPVMHTMVPWSASMQRVTLCMAPTAISGLGQAALSRTAAMTSLKSCAAPTLKRGAALWAGWTLLAQISRPAAMALLI